MRVRDPYAGYDNARPESALMRQQSVCMAEFQPCPVAPFGPRRLRDTGNAATLHEVRTRAGTVHDQYPARHYSAFTSRPNPSHQYIRHTDSHNTPDNRKQDIHNRNHSRN
uniref:hypothetical protein n=1 Tax=Komagataeibacter kakiaceti TaxID=943261 RepID=UPI0005552C89